jgi:alpha-ribazole phosphatase
LGVLWLVRHAPTARSGVCYGQSDVPVTLEPAAAASVIAERWEKLNPRLVPELWSSPWARTRPVAEHLAERWQTTCRVDARLSELDFGRWESREYAEIERSEPARFRAWLAAYEEEAPPGGESAAALRTRVAEWLDDVADAPRVLALTHAGVIRMARSLTRRLAYTDVALEPVPHLEPERFAR